MEIPVTVNWVNVFSPAFHRENISYAFDIRNKYVSASTWYFLSGMNSSFSLLHLRRYHNSLSLHMDTCSHMQKMVNLFNAEGKKFLDFKKNNFG